MQANSEEKRTSRPSEIHQEGEMEILYERCCCLTYTSAAPLLAAWDRRTHIKRSRSFDYDWRLLALSRLGWHQVSHVAMEAQPLLEASLEPDCHAACWSKSGAAEVNRLQKVPEGSGNIARLRRF
jgi:hypothetical protein